MLEAIKSKLKEEIDTTMEWGKNRDRRINAYYQLQMLQEDFNKEIEEAISLEDDRQQTAWWDEIDQAEKKSLMEG